MPRRPRILSDSGMYHIVMRGNNKQNLFIEESDYIFFLKRLKKYLAETDIHLYAYCLMTNHSHLLIGNVKNNLSTFMKKLCVSYAIYFNTKYERTGHLFQDRFKSEPITSSQQFKVTLRYILLNPSKAGLSKNHIYKWNSYNNMISGDKIIKIEYISQEFGNIKNALDFISQNNNDHCMDFDAKTMLNDYHCLKFIRKHLKIYNPITISGLSQKKKQKTISILKAAGFSYRAISRVTEISRGELKRLA